MSYGDRDQERHTKKNEPSNCTKRKSSRDAPVCRRLEQSFRDCLQPKEADHSHGGGTSQSEKSAKTGPNPRENRENDVGDDCGAFDAADDGAGLAICGFFVVGRRSLAVAARDDTQFLREHSSRGGRG